MLKVVKNLPYLTKRNSNLNNPDATRLFTFSKDERLCSIKHISSLIENGTTLHVVPLKFIYHIVNVPISKSLVQVLIIAPKRIFKTAPARNSIKRRLRECYRLSKPAFYDALSKKNIHLHLAIIYNKPLELPYTDILKAMEAGLQKVLIQIDKKA